MTEGLIAALATPLGQSAIAVIRTSGPEAVEAVSRLCKHSRKVLAAPGNTVLRTLLVDPADGSNLDEVLLLVFRSPRSYTGEESVEIHCHGSLPGIDAILALLFRNGFRPAQAGEFSLRAFLNGKLDLTRAEAVHDIVTARSHEAQALALHRLGGAVFRRIDELKHAVLRQVALLAVQLDYAEDEIDVPALDTSPLVTVRDRIRELAGTWALGRRYHDGVRIALAGRTNAGKSSLFNALVREDRAIVSDQHGTTRDWIEASLVLDGIPVRLFDTAGLRATVEAIEAEGIRRSGEVIASSAIVLYVVDAVAGLDAHDRENLDRCIREAGAVVIVWNKMDASAKPAPTDYLLGDYSLPVCPASALQADGLAPLHCMLLPLVRGGQRPEDGAVLIDSERQYRLLERAALAIDRALETHAAGWGFDAMSLDVQDALAALGEITGEVSSDDVLSTVFSSFCVGK